MASRQIIDVAARLQAADRALLELSFTRGLDDTRIAQLTGMPEGSVSSRRRQVLTTLAAELGLAADDVVAALRADGTPQAPTPDSDDAAPASPTPAVDAPPTQAPVAARASPAPADPVVGDTPRHRRRPWIVAALLTGTGVVALVLLLTLGGTSRRRLPHSPRTRVPIRRRVPARARSGSNSSRTPVPTQLRPLPDGLPHASGTLTLSRRHGTLTLTLNVGSLPPLRHGHYEAWLYDSILDSRALGAVRSDGITRLRLPADAAGYRQIDVSYQPRGVVSPSGESRLRGPNPAHH